MTKEWNCAKDEKDKSENYGREMNYYKEKVNRCKKKKCLFCILLFRVEYKEKSIG